MTATRRPISVAAVLLASGVAAHAADPAPPATLPITAITLYRSGVGSFERGGKVSGDALVSLRFEIEQINDILKSLVVLDRAGGTVRSVGYGSKQPLERRLAAFGVNIGDNPSVATLLSRLRGARLRAVTAEGPVEGVILGVEQRDTPAPAPANAAAPAPVVPTDYVNLVTTAGVRSLAIPRLTGFELLDPKLNDELTRALAALAERRDERSAAIDLMFAGKGDRPVSLAYVQQTPVWKTSYRLVLPEETTGKPLLQGWAIVENTTDEDWKDVRLALASGNPVGFRMDLHEPLYIDRPLLPVPSMAFGRPRTYEADMLASVAKTDRGRAAVSARAPATMSQSTVGGAMAQEMVGVARESAQSASADMVVRSTAPSLAAAGEAGEQFRYEITAPVSIERQRSAMIPILAADIRGARVSVFNPADNPNHPMRGVSIVNESGFDLSPGPITVYDGAAYAGDAQIAYTARGQERLLSYAVDLDVLANVKSYTTTSRKRLRISNGQAVQEGVLRATTAYAFTSRDQKRPRTILVEQPIKPGYDLVTPDKPRGETATLRRFEVAVEPGAKAELTVTEQQTMYSSVQVTGFAVETVLAYQQEGKASPAVVEAVRKAADMQAAINDLNAEIETLKSETRAIGEDQNRIRGTMATIGPNAELYARLLKKLTEQENRLETIAERQSTLQTRLDTARRDLDAYIKDLNVE